MIDILKEIANDPGLSEAYAALLDLERITTKAEFAQIRRDDEEAAEAQANSIHVRGSARWLEVRDEETEPKRRVNGELMFDFDLDCDD